MSAREKYAEHCIRKRGRGGECIEGLGGKEKLVGVG